MVRKISLTADASCGPDEAGQQTHWPWNHKTEGTATDYKDLQDATEIQQGKKIKITLTTTMSRMPPDGGDIDKIVDFAYGRQKKGSLWAARTLTLQDFSNPDPTKGHDSNKICGPETCQRMLKPHALTRHLWALLFWTKHPNWIPSGHGIGNGIHLMTTTVGTIAPAILPVPDLKQRTTRFRMFGRQSQTFGFIKRLQVLLKILSRSSLLNESIRSPEFLGIPGWHLSWSNDWLHRGALPQTMPSPHTGFSS